MGHFHDLTYVCAPAPFQVATAAGIEQLPEAFYRQIAADHQSKRGRLLRALEDAGMKPSIPSGAYYIMASADRLPGKTSAEKARALLRLTGVASVAGSAFFRAGRGENLLRFCFAKQDAELDGACDRLRRL
jgi:aminotransferase